MTLKESECLSHWDYDKTAPPGAKQTPPAFGVGVPERKGAGGRLRG